MRSQPTNAGRTEPTTASPDSSEPAGSAAGPAAGSAAESATGPARTAAAQAGPGNGDTTVFVQLVVMMLLEFAVFGSWFATVGLVLATNGLPTVIGTAFSLAAVAAIVSPMLLGALGDRFMASQKTLGLAHLLGGAVMLFLPAAVQAGSGNLVLGLVFVYMLFFQPTLGLTNAIAFRHLGANQRRFPYVRVFGTVGWVVAGALVGWMGLSSSVGLFYVTAVFSFALGLYSFTLPATPPPAKGVRFSPGDLVGAKAFRLMRHRNYAVLMVCALLTSVSLGVYNTYASAYLGALGFSNVAGTLSLGQASEVAFIVTIPFVLKHVGMKWALFAGMCMWAVRFALFAQAADGGHWTAITAIVLQGICQDFFLVLAAMYIGQAAPVELTAQAQSMLILVVSGFGQFIGAFASGKIYDATVGAQAHSTPADWTAIWALPIGSAFLAALVWAVLFRHPRKQEPAVLEA
ncbi:MFS transporter [Streptomyces sp. NPDC003247]|uniref:MFS transporter n=1 Tax=Streptomyces sp. NPDC003247 TaxID=3364677 RepID=UPI0036A942C5